MSESDIQKLSELPDVKIWGADFSKLYDVKFYKGKFVVTDAGKLIIKVVPKIEWDAEIFYHNGIVGECDIEHPESNAVKHAIKGGGKIEIELVDDTLECRLYGRSTVYGYYDPEMIDQARLETALEATFHVGMMPVLVIKQFEPAMS